MTRRTPRLSTGVALLGLGLVAACSSGTSTPKVAADNSTKGASSVGFQEQHKGGALRLVAK